MELSDLHGVYAVLGLRFRLGGLGVRVGFRV